MLLVFISSDRRVVRASGSGAVYSGLIPSRVMILKLVSTASLPDAQHCRDSEENKLASLLVVPLGKARSEIPPVIETAPKQAHYSASIAFSRCSIKLHMWWTSSF